MMKKIVCTFSAMALLATVLKAQTLFTYGNKAVSQEEFMRAFEKNPEPGDKQKAMKEYLPLYINYKLKVQDALDKKMDTLSNQKDEFLNYRTQLAETYISDKSNVHQLILEAFNRSQQDVRLGHLFIGYDAKDSSSVQKAKEAAAKAYAELKAKHDFAAVVNKYSTEERNKATNGDAGWITAFSIPYAYETAVYNLPAGGYTEPLKSNAGFHIFKKIDERPAAGQVKVAQIMLVNTDKTNPANEVSIKKMADSLYQALQNGAAFDSLAIKYSNDRTSYNSGGVLPVFGVGQYNMAFETQAFQLKNKGDISKPFATEYGWHILKLLDRFPVAATVEEADANGMLQQQVISSGRSKTARINYIESQIPKLAFTKAPVKEADLWQYTDSSMAGSAKTKSLAVKNTTPVFSFGNQVLTANDWLQFVKIARMTPGPSNSKAYPDLMKDFIIESAEKTLLQNLEKTDPAFARQLNEFKEANLLFEAMDKNVWSKASADSAALAKYYLQHKDKYRWGPSAAALLVTSTDSATTVEVRDFLRSHLADWKQLSEKYPVNLIADSGRYEISQIPVVNNETLTKGMLTTPVKNEMDGSQTFAAIFDILPANGQRSFEEARGFVINDYQQVLEDRWLANLNKKYPVKINDSNWHKLLAAK